MISFLNAFILPALVAASIPLILHFLNRQKAKKLPFSSIRFLKKIEHQRIKQVKLYQILLILVRTLFIVFLILVFARPSINITDQNISEDTQTTAVIIIDDSYSMQAFASSQTFFDLAKEKLFELLEIFNAQDKVFLISDRLKNPLLLNSQTLKSAIEKLNVSNARFDFRENLLRADSLFRSNINLNNELFLLSDNKIPVLDVPFSQFSDIRQFKAYKFDFAENFSFKNIGIDSVILQQQLFEVNQKLELSVYLTNFSDASVETNLNLYLDNERMDFKKANIEPNEKKAVPMYYTPKRGGTHFIKAQLDEDDLSLDNTFYLSFNIPEKLNILNLSASSSVEMMTALKVLNDNTLFNIDIRDYNEWLGLDISKYDVIVIDDLPTVDKTTSERLKEYISGGKSVVIIPGNTIDIFQYNNFFNSLIGKQLFLELRVAGDNAFFSIENQKSANQIFDALFRDKSDNFATPRLFKYFRFNNFNNSLISLKNGDSYLVRFGRVFVFSSSFASTWSDFANNGLYVPMLYRSLFLAAQTQSVLNKQAKIGENIVFKIQNNQLEETYIVKDPRTDELNILPIPMNNYLFFEKGPAAFPGFYSLFNKGLPLQTIAINHDPLELKKPYITSDSLNTFFKTLPENNLKEEIYSARVGFELWMIFLILALLMLIGELLLIKKIEGTSFFKKL